MSFLNRLKAAKTVALNYCLVEDFLSAKECRAILDETSLNTFTDTGIVSLANELVINEKVRKTSQQNYVQEALSAKLSDAAQAHYGFEIARTDGLLVLSYGIGGHYKPHVDCGTIRVEDERLVMHKYIARDISVVVFLNDDFKGGEFAFSFGPTIVPKAGALLMFPSDWQHTHEVLPVTSGHRYSVVTWFQTTPEIVPERDNVPGWVSFPGFS